MGYFDGKTALVTGAAEGVGVAFANALAAEGCSVAICDVRDNVQARADEIAAKHGVETLAFNADTGVAADCWRVVDGVMAAWGRLDILVNNDTALIGEYTRHRRG